MKIDFVAILVLKQCILYFLIQYFLEGSLWRYYQSKATKRFGKRNMKGYKDSM
jgi:hypothetical protein